MRDPDEKARFRGNDKAYEEGYDRIFGKREDEVTKCEHMFRRLTVGNIVDGDMIYQPRNSKLICVICSEPQKDVDDVK